MWHANGSVKMGRPDDLMACVGPDFKLHGLENLRVVDLSVCPFTPKYDPFYVSEHIWTRLTDR